MTIKQFEPFLTEETKKKVELENEKYDRFLLLHELLGKMTSFSPDIEALRNATIALASLAHKISRAFTHGYFGLKEEAMGKKDESEALYNEITEYLSLVEAGIDSFVETHPITFEEAANEEQ